MSYDIYGNPLRRGHCEVHPHVHEEYPCSVCVAESRRRQEAQSPAQCSGNPAYCESAHYLGQAQEEIKSLNDEIQALRKDALRYRWLRRNWFTMSSDYTGGRVEFKTGLPRYSEATEKDVDAAIDHARCVERGQK